MALTLTVDAGPNVVILYSPSKSHMPRGAVEDFIPITQEFSVEDDLLDDADQAIAAGLRREGYWKASARHVQSTPSPDRLVITFDITRGKRYRIDRVEVPDGLQATRAMFEAEPALKPGAWFNEERVTIALRRVIQARYEQAGYHEVSWLPELEEVPGTRGNEGRLVIRPAIKEGVKATVSSVTFKLDPSARVPEATLRGRMTSAAGRPYVFAQAIADREALVDYYTEQGFLSAKASIDTTFNADRTQVTLVVAAHEGPQVSVGSIAVRGYERISRDVILGEITLRVGGPYSEAARIESQRRIFDLGSFRNVQVTAEPRAEGDAEQRITITVVESPSSVVGGGGGLEVASRPRSLVGGAEEDRIELSPRAFLEYGRRNLGGRNRMLNVFARISAKPTNAPGDPERDGKGFGFSEYRLSTTYRERNAFRSNTDLLVGFTSEQAVRTSFNFFRQVANAEILHQFARGISVSGRYALEFNKLFDERIKEVDQPDIDRLFPQVRLSILSSGLAVDRRDDPIATTRGWFAAATGDLAMRQIGSEVGYVKTFMQGVYFRPLTSNRRLVLALRAQLGLARGFEREVPRLEEDGQQALGPDGKPAVDVVEDLPASQRFFAGGGTSVRGFDVDRLGVTEILNVNGLSNGGNGLVILNAELRALVGNVFSRPFAVVGFVDSGNVFQRAGNVDLGRLRGSVGLGVRWDSPIGPLRFDLGRKLSQSIFVSGKLERKWGWHFSLGQTF